MTTTDSKIRGQEGLKNYKTPNPGDYGCVRTNGPVGLLIRLFLRAKINHVFIYMGDGEIVEARPIGATRSQLAKYNSKDVFWSDEDLDASQRRLITRKADMLVGTPYGFLDIIFLWAKLFGIHLHLVEYWVKRDDRMICSQLVAECYRTAGLRLFNKEPYLVTPKELYQRTLETE